jgi:drug/metabolite transporter (DMT)-like permease
MKNSTKLGGVLGIVYALAGFVLIFLGWNGAASKDRAPSQIPYLISGGIAGLALVVLGAALMVAYSLREDRVRLHESIEGLRTAVTRIAATDTPGDRSGATAGGASGGTVLAGASSFHAAGCTLIEGQTDLQSLSREDAVASGRQPCRICNP